MRLRQSSGWPDTSADSVSPSESRGGRRREGTTQVTAVRHGEFRNEPISDFAKAENRKAMEEALSKVAGELGREYPLLIGGEAVRTEEKLRSLNPSRPEQVVGVFQRGTAELANRAVEAAHGAFDRWKRVPAEERAERLFRAGELLRKRRFEMNAWICYEVGKTWPEADADTAETIDFCEFYAREMLRLGGRQPCTPVRGEKNYLVYIPLGAGVVIPPWNFPSAIVGGMTLAAVVTGNTVVLKPSSDSPTVAAKLVEILYDAGVPEDAVNFFTGPGGTAGEALVTHPKTRFIAFTGSKEAGLRIGEQAAKKQPGQVWIKRTVLEMGGKDAIIVDDEADLDAAVEGVTVSAFGYQGQKCSACSRAIVADKVYDRFLEKLTKRVGEIRVGPADDPANSMGPVINESAMRSILQYIETGKKEGRLVAGGQRAEGSGSSRADPDRAPIRFGAGRPDEMGRGGYFIEPTVIADVDRKARIAQEEIFGPVLAVIRAKDFDHALQIANDTEYGLTGAVYSKDPAKLERAAEEFHVGNLYFNRKCTGALVGAHPFGGFNMSGTDSKAGGKDYLLLFLQGKAVGQKLEQK